MYLDFGTLKTSENFVGNTFPMKLKRFRGEAGFKSYLVR